MSEPTELIEIRGLAKYFGRFAALRDLRLSVRKGQFIALFGRNGAGKTTLLRILAGLSRASAGTVSVHGCGPGAARGEIGYLSHNTAIYLDLTALENLRFYARLLDLPADDAELEDRIALVGLAGRSHEPVRNFSRGMQQRLGIARAFLHDPAILLLDEPFTGLDQAGTEFLQNYLRGAHAGGRTCLMAIHDAPVGYALADRLVVINRGGVALDLARGAVTLEDFQERYKALAEDR
jgi:heme ABC exporter ATP-binding subunit CcmA